MKYVEINGNTIAYGMRKGECNLPSINKRRKTESKNSCHSKGVVVTPKAFIDACLKQHNEIMLAASQDTDYFIERQRSQLNKGSNRQQVNRQRPAPPSLPSSSLPPPPPPQFLPPNNFEERLDFKVARILDEPPPRVQSQQLYFPPSPPPLTGNSFFDQQQQQQQQQMSYFPEPDQRRYSNDTGNGNPTTFFDRFGDHDNKRAQLKDDLKREYNEYLQSHRGPKSKSTSQIASPRRNTTRRVQFEQNGMVVAPWEKKDGKTMRNVQSMNDISSSSTMTTRDYTTNRSQSRVSRNDEQYIRDREEYILELHDQIRELEARRRQLEMGSFSRSFQGSRNKILSFRKQQTVDE